MSEWRSRSTSRPKNYRDFERAGTTTVSDENTDTLGHATSNDGNLNQGELTDITLEAPNRDSDIDGPYPNKSKKMGKKKNEPPVKDKAKGRSKNPSVNLIPSGMVSMNVQHIENDEILEEFEGRSGHENDKSSMTVT